MRLLIVDDCADILHILSSFMELSGYETNKALNGLEAIELLRKDSYDVVITDAEMPAMDGRKLCKYIKSVTPGIYIIGMSGSPQALDELRTAGADIVFSKPFRLNDLDKAIENNFLH